ESIRYFKLVIAHVCVAKFHFELTDISFFKPKHHFFGMNPIINRDEPCSSNVIVLNNHKVLRLFQRHGPFQAVQLYK
ncbi:hypothetical protein DQ905_20040, partial [Salmonella enterica subsp. enterica serovar Oranienburg]|nr:hypothetical protein [Salmonella enterica subsp. enterica serovar Oranienburg]